MGIFSRKSSGNGDSGSFDFSDFDYIDDENLSAPSIPEMNYDEFDKGISNDDPLGIDSENSKKKDDPKDKQGVNPMVKVIAGAAVVGSIIMGIMYIADDGVDGGGNTESAQQQSEEEDGRDNEEKSSSRGVVVTEEVGKEYTSSADGNPINGTGAILAFDYAYYVLRDGEKARSIFNPDITDYEGSYIQREIDKVPQGVKHELSITPRSIGESYDVKLTLSIPGAEPVTYSQEFTTMEKDGKYYVKTFQSADIDEEEEG